MATVNELTPLPPPPPQPFFPGFPPLDQLPHDDVGSQLNFTIWLLVGLAAAFLALRIYCKFLRRRGLWWDDYMLIAAWSAIAISTGFTTYTIVELDYGKHVWDIGFEKLRKMPLPANIGGSLSTLAAVWSKTAFAITILRISDGWVRKFIWFIIISMNLFMTVSALMLWIQCTPIQKTWDFTVPGTCWPIKVLTIYDTFSAAYSAAMDFILALLPWKIILSMTMNKKEKLGVLIAMSMGVFAGITAVIKTTKIHVLEDPDIFNGVDLIIWGTAESAVTIMAASIPVLRALMRDSRPGPPRFYSFTGVSTKDRGQARRQLTDSYFRGPSPSAFASTNNLLDGKGGDWKQSSPVDTVPPSPPPTLATLRPISILRMPSVDFGDGTVLRTPRTPKNVHVRFSEKIG